MNLDIIDVQNQKQQQENEILKLNEEYTSVKFAKDSVRIFFCHRKL